jgi:ElaB/YqjD/DUF883 family membrane-anchored ribosome-binding protein
VDDSARIAELESVIEIMRAEIAALREIIAENNEEENRGIEMAGIKSLMEDGFSRISEAIRPVMEKLNVKLGKPAGDAVNSLEEKIAEHPFKSVTIALVTGFAIGKAVGFFISRSLRKE